MNIRSCLRAAWLAAALALSLVANAEPAFTRAGVNLRAGPSTDYPVVVQLRPGQSLEVVGCTADYGWCDVVLPDGLRGWVAASLLDYPWGGSPVPLAQYGAAIGVPIIVFSLGRYWGDHYRDRPWYRDSRWWRDRPPPPLAGWHRPPPPAIGWQPRPPRPGWHPPAPPRPAPGWQGRSDRPRPGWQGRPDRPRPPGMQERPRHPRADGPPARPRPPGAQGGARPGPGASQPRPPPRSPSGPRGTVRPSPGQNVPLGDRP